MATKKRDRVEPIVLTGENESFTLEFNRASVEYAEKHGFSIEELTSGAYLSGTSELFYYAFRMHHPRMTKAQTDEILFEELGGMPDGMAERLGELFAEPYNALVQTEENAKNSKWKVTM